ncbi:bifunctional 4-hydroxy-2-oxoglutarate aldolase/2-dehydro-3-deoxy-phosphogluconate aldolase [Stutzerimonas degradans]
MTMQLKNDLIEQLCVNARILPVITIGSEEQILPLSDALAAGGLRTLEITLRSAHGLTAIRRLREERPELCIGAGTVLDRRMMDQVEAAGAQFVVTPGASREVLEAGVQCAVPVLPGIATATEIMEGYALGYRRFKLFPAEVCGGIAALKAFGGPFADVRFCPTGGVNAGNAAQYLALGNVMCVGGTWMIDAASLAGGDWARIRQATADALAALG